MKTLMTILKQSPVYLNDWSSKIGVIGDFENIHISTAEYLAEKCPYRNEAYWIEKKASMKKALDEYREVNILFASYGYANYEGNAWVLFEKNGNLYEVNGGHCSCCGLENQWEPEETTLEAIKMRLLEGRLGKNDYSGNEFANELREFIGIEAKETT